MKKIIATVAIAAFALSASTASAFSWSSNDIEVKNYNDATVTNVVNTGADTGGNVSVGGNARAKARGGDATANGGDAGSVDSGNATAASYVDNTVNSNLVKVTKDCGCKGDVEVKNRNNAELANIVGTSALTSGNSSVGGEAKAKASAKSSHSRHHRSGSSDAEANGGDAGSANSGDADSTTGVVNVVNSNIVRVR